MIRALVIVALLGSVAHADPAGPPGTIEEAPPRRTPFDQGRFSLGFGAGSQTAFGQRYYAVGGGAGYFVLDGVEIELSGQYQWGDGPSITRLTPGLRYVAQPLVGKWPVIPYVGAFYSHWFIGENLEDQDALGGRAGLLYVSGSVVLGLGAAYEHLISQCTTNCSAIYPDITIAVAL